MLRKSDGTIRKSGEEKIRVPALSAMWMEGIQLPEMEVRQEYISYALYEKEKLVSSSSVILSDNYFDMDGGERKVKIISGEPVGLKLRSVYDIR